MAGTAIYNHSHQDLHTQTQPKTTKYTVQRGDTVWSIAESVNADQSQDTRYIVDEIMTLNHLGDATIQPGETLEVPVSK